MNSLMQTLSTFLEPRTLARVLTLLGAFCVSSPNAIAQVGALPNTSPDQSLAMERQRHRDEMLKAIASQKASGAFKERIPLDELGIHKGADIAGVKGAFDEWDGYVDGTLYRILAGNEFSSQATGEIILDWGAKNGTEFYKIPKSGLLEIVDAHEGTVFLRAASGKVYRFHIVSRKID